MRSRTMSPKIWEDMMWQKVEACVNGNGVLMFVTIARHLGFGKKRMLDLLKAYNEVQEEFHEYELQGVFDIMVEREFSDIGLDINEMLPKAIDFRQHRRNMKRKNEKLKAPVSKKEAEALYSKLAAFKNYTDSLKKTEV